MLNRLSHPGALTIVFLKEAKSWSQECGLDSLHGIVSHKVKCGEGNRLQAISPEPDAGLELTDREIVTGLKSDA